MTVNDREIKEGITLLDRINFLQHGRHDPHVTIDQVPVIWHRPEDILNAMSVIDMLKTRGMLDQHMALVEQRMRDAGVDPKVRLDG